MWDTAELVDVFSRGGRVAVAIKFSNGKEEVIEEIGIASKVDALWLELVARQRLQQLNDIYDYASSLVLGTIDLSKLPQPTQAELDERAYFEKKAALEAAQAALAKQYLKPDAKIDALAIDVKDTGKLEYYGIK